MPDARESGVPNPIRRLITMQQKDYYKALGVSESASIDEIKKAYREIAKKYHPDLNPGDKAAEEKFKEASEAYDTLGDPEKKEKYDRIRKFGGGMRTGGGRTGFTQDDGMSYEEFMRQFGTAAQRERYGGAKQSTESDFSFSDIFGNLFRDRKAKPGAGKDDPQPTDDPFFKRKGNDAYVEVAINVAQAILGSRIRVRTPSGKRVTVRIAAGTDPEKMLRVRGMGFASMTGVGDLYIRIHVAMPKNLTPEQKEQVRTMAAALGLRH